MRKGRSPWILRVRYGDRTFQSQGHRFSAEADQASRYLGAYPDTPGKPGGPTSRTQTECKIVASLA